LLGRHPLLVRYSELRTTAGITAVSLQEITSR
jgi:hypothetical protein